MNKKRNKIQSLNPLSSLYIVILFAIASFLFNYQITIVVVVIMALFAIAAGEGKKFILGWLKSVFLICTICFVTQSLFIPGEVVIWEFWVFAIRQESLAKAIILSSRIMGIGTSILLASKIIKIKDLMSVFEKMGMSPSASYVLLSTTNIIPQMSKKMNTIMDAQKARGIETDSNLLVRAKAFFPAIGPLLLNSIVNAEERAITLEARAFSASCKKTKLHEIPDARSDKTIRIMCVIALILLLGGKIVSWNI